MSDLAATLTRVKSDYLDKHNIGIRRFAELSGLSRTRLVRLFSGKESATIGEFNAISEALNGIEVRHQTVLARKANPAQAQNAGLAEQAVSSDRIATLQAQVNPTSN